MTESTFFFIISFLISPSVFSVGKNGKEGGAAGDDDR
jgi:hypothetical protein